MKAWGLVLLMVVATTAGDVVQSKEMKRHADSSIEDTALAIFRRPLLLAGVACMAISFFAFIVLLSFADLSFAVPASAASFVLETILASTLLHERVDSRRWAGTLLVAGGVVLLAV